MLIGAEAGMGKSMLIAELGARAASRGMRVLAASAWRSATASFPTHR